MKNLLIVLGLAFLALLNTGMAQTYVPGGIVSGTWSLSGSPYVVTGDLQIPSSSLVIEPGVQVLFQGLFKIDISGTGRILAIGTEESKIVFTIEDTTGFSSNTHYGWGGIRFGDYASMSAAADSSILAHCFMSYGKSSKGGSLFVKNFSRLKINHLNIQKNFVTEEGSGIYLYSCSNIHLSNLSISDCVADKKGAGLFCSSTNPLYLSNAVIESNKITTPIVSKNCGGGGMYLSGVTAYFDSVLIRNNTAPFSTANNNTNWTGGAGIYAVGVTINPDNTGLLEVINNTGGGGGIYCRHQSSYNFHRTIVAGNSYYQLFVDDSPCYLTNMTISSVGSYTGIYAYYTPNLFLQNCILWGTGSATCQVGGDGTTMVDYSCIKNGTSGICNSKVWGVGNISDNPIFVSSSQGDFHLEWESPCKNAGNPGLGYDPDGSILDLGAYYYPHQQTSIPAGWSGISSFADPFDDNLEVIFSSLQDTLISLQNLDGGVYLPGENVNTIGPWNFLDGYAIKVAFNIDSFTFKGYPTTQPDVYIDAGWNLIPVLSVASIPVESLFSDFGNSVFVKEVAGSKVFWPAYGINSLLNLSPGKSYFVYTVNPGTIHYPSGLLKSSINNSIKERNFSTPWGQPAFTPSSHSIAFPNDVVNSSPLLQGDIIGAFTSENKCVGIERFDTGSFALSVFADDTQTPESDGFVEGEQLMYKIWRPGTKEEFEVNVEYEDSWSSGTFTTNGMSVIKNLHFLMSTNSPSDFGKISFYPVPADDYVLISGLPKSCKISITNLSGLVYYSKICSQNDCSIDVSRFQPGIYFVTFEMGTQVDVRKLVKH